MRGSTKPTAKEVVDELRPLGTEGYRKVLRNHGVPDPMFGVKIEDLKRSSGGSRRTTGWRWTCTTPGSTTPGTWPG